jgi:DNA-binding transcriptional LysR family regulator
MAQPKINDLQAFLAVAREQSFTRAAGKMGITPSGLSHTISGLEARLGVRLLARTTRNVSTTEAGDRLMQAIGPLLDQVAAEVAAIGELRDKPAGSLRITCTDDSIEMCLRPMLASFLAEYPDISIELSVDYGFVNIVESRFDAGVRLGEAVGKDMIAVRIGPDWRLSVVATPAYFARHAPPTCPQDLVTHNCINFRLSTSGAFYAWEFEKDGRKFNVRVDGQLSANSTLHILHGALDGVGLAYVPEHLAKPYIDAGRLVEVMADWSPTFQGFHLYYPHRRQASSAFAALVEALRYRG